MALIIKLSLFSSRMSMKHAVLQVSTLLIKVLDDVFLTTKLATSNDICHTTNCSFS